MFRCLHSSLPVDIVHYQLLSPRFMSCFRGGGGDLGLHPREWGSGIATVDNTLLQGLLCVRNHTMAASFSCCSRFWQLMHESSAQTSEQLWLKAEAWWQCGSRGLVFLVARLQPFKFPKVMTLWVAHIEEFSRYEV